MMTDQRGWTRRPWSAVLAAVAIAITAGGRGHAQQPVFRAAVELTSIDLSVVDDKGRVVTDLKPDEFTVRVDGSTRTVVSADWVGLQTKETPPAPPAPPGYTGNENATGGRLIMLVVDEPNIRFGGTLGIRGAVNAFIDRLQPTDRAAVIGIGQGAPSTPFTNDRARLKKAVERLVGQYQPQAISEFNLTVFESLQIQRGMPGVLEEVIVRECAGMAGPAFDACGLEVQQAVHEKALTGAANGQHTIGVLRSLLNALKSIDGPKTMVLVSEGFIADDQRQSVIELGAIAAASKTSIYALRLDDQLFQNLAQAGARMAMMDDRFMRSEGLELLTSASRGAMFNVMGTGAAVFERVESELSGYYLLGVESSPVDHDGKSHNLRIEVARKGLTVRARRALVTPLDDGKVKSARDLVVAAVNTPLPIAALPLRVATFSLPSGDDADKVDVLVHADIGTDYAAPKITTVGYLVLDEEGRQVDSRVGDARLPPVMNGVPSALQFTGTLSLKPGTYTLKLGVNEGDRTGTVEHEFSVGVQSVGPLKLSDLMVGGPLNGAEDLLQPSVGYTVVFGTVQGYVEARGVGANELRATFELARSETGDALISQDVQTRTDATHTRAILSAAVPVRQLPPGPYYLRALLSGPQGVLRRYVRPFEVAAPAVLMTSADSGSILSTADVFLPVVDSALSRTFEPRDLWEPDTLKAFRDRVAVPAREAFDAGVAAMQARDYAKAEASFKSALATDGENTSVLAYLAGVFAAVGRDDQSTGAWQTSLVDGSDMPQIYGWLTDALMREHRYAEARGTLEEAIAKWPGDLRFVRPMALIAATFGEGPQAVRLMARYLEQNPDDVESLQLGVEWIYHLKLARAAARTPAADLTLARSYADAYARLKGPQQALVKQWIDFLGK